MRFASKISKLIFEDGRLGNTPHIVASTPPFVNDLTSLSTAYRIQISGQDNAEDKGDIIMKKSGRFTFIIGFISGAVLFGAVTAFAATIAALPKTAEIRIDGLPVDLEGYVIEGHHYFQLRDLSAALATGGKDFSVVWQGDQNRVTIDTSRGYDPNERDPDEEPVIPSIATVSFERHSAPAAELEQKNVRFADGEFAWFRRLHFKTTSESDHVTSISIPGTKGTVRWYDRTAARWQTKPLGGQLPDTTLFIETDRHYMVISQPYAYKPLERTSIEERPRLPLEAKIRKDGQVEIIMRFKQTTGLIGDIWAIQSNDPLIEWNDLNDYIWPGYTQTATQRWHYDGFYSKTPENYNPTSSTMFYRNAAAWLTNALVRTGGSRASYCLGWAMLDTLLENQNEAGFWPTAPQSDWLYADYGIGPGFYDTRFNNDITYTLLIADHLVYNSDPFARDNRFTEAACRQADFLVWLAENHHFAIDGPNGTGWLVEDYYWPDGSFRKTHSSLNHMLQEMLTLQTAYRFTGKTRYLDTFDKMLLGLKNTRDKWIMPDGNLEYAYMPDGSMGLVDYPYLTYNDLFDVQRALESMGRDRDPDLQTLMDSKLKWMQANGVTGYRS